MIKVAKTDTFDGDILRAELAKAKITISDDLNAIEDVADGFITIHVDASKEAKVLEIIDAIF
jgi:hypothetical protein